MAAQFTWSKRDGLFDLESKACVKPYQSIEELKKSLIKAWKEIPMEMIQKAIDDFPKRLKACIEANGDHFENRLNMLLFLCLKQKFRWKYVKKTQELSGHPVL